MSVEGPWPDSSALLDSVAAALNHFDWSKVETICRSGTSEHPSLLQRLDNATVPFPTGPACDLLKMLRRKCRFELMGILADAFLRSGTESAEIRKLYAQAMIDQGNLTAAEVVLGAVLADTQAPAREHYEAEGLLGRIYKQLYVNARQPHNTRQQQNLAKAIDYYWHAYAARKQSNIWQGVNVLALMARARRDGFPIDRPFTETLLSTEIQDVLKQKQEEDGSLEYWDSAIAMETAVATWDLARTTNAEVADQRAGEVISWLHDYLRDMKVDAFECASTLRQLREVWELETDKPPGSSLISALQASLLSRDGGENQLRGSEVREGLEKNFASEGDLPLRWWQTGLKRCMAVARIENLGGKAMGTGFLVRGGDFLDDFGDQPLLLTNWHVVSVAAEHPLSIAPREAIAFFEGCGKQSAVKEIVAFSRKMDATFLSLDSVSLEQGHCPVEPPAAQFDSTKKQRLYIIGHPGGRSLSFSLFDSIWLDADGVRLHYRTPTEGGSSGSPVFDQDNWTLVALHHAGLATMPKLHNISGTYEANEGIAVTAIREAVRQNRMS